MSDCDGVFPITDMRSMFPSGLIQPECACRFGADALLLAAFANSLVRETPDLSGKKCLRIAELGCGCGACLLGCGMLCPNAALLGIDREQILLTAARGNAQILKLAARTEFLQADLRMQKALPACLAASQDLVLANPPWHSPEAGRPSPNIFRQKAYHVDCLETFCQSAKKLLRPRGRFLLVLTPSLFCRLCRFLPDMGIGLRLVWPLAPRKGNQYTRMLVMCRKDCATDPVFQWPLALHEADGSFTGEALRFCPWLAKMVRKTDKL